MRAKIIAVGLLIFVSGLQCAAQTYYGGLRGTVVDPTGQAIAGGTVKLKNEPTNVERSVVTNGYGEYVIRAHFMDCVRAVPKIISMLPT